MRALIFGASGLLGKDLVSAFATEDVLGLSSKDADLRDARQVLSSIRQAQPDWIILSAAYADVDACEKDPVKAFAVNRDGAAHVARAAAQIGSRLLFLSSDYVFNGEKRTPYETEDPKNPIIAGNHFRVLHRPHLVAVRFRRKMFPGHDAEAGQNSA